MGHRSTHAATFSLAPCGPPVGEGRGEGARHAKLRATRLPNVAAPLSSLSLSIHELPLKGDVSHLGSWGCSRSTAPRPRATRSVAPVGPIPSGPCRHSDPVLLRNRRRFWPAYLVVSRARPVRRLGQGGRGFVCLVRSDVAHVGGLGCVGARGQHAPHIVKRTSSG